MITEEGERGVYVMMFMCVMIPDDTLRPVALLPPADKYLDR